MPLLAALACLSIFAPAAPAAEPERGFHPYAAFAMEDDSNPLRAPDGSADERSDRISTLEAGAGRAGAGGHQRLTLDGRAYRREFDHFAELNHTGGNAGVRWQGDFGRAWDAELGYRFDRRLRDFANQIDAVRDLRDRHSVRGELGRRLDPRWRLRLATAWDELWFEQATLDKTRAGGTLSLDYVSLAGNSLGLAARYQETRFQAQHEQDFDELRFGPTLYWRPTGKLSLRGGAGYLRRDHEEPARRSYDTAVGQLSALWEVTAKTRAKLSVWREVGNLDDEVAERVVTVGLGVEPSWEITERTSLRLRGAYEERDFGGTPGGSDQAGRADRLSFLEAGLAGRMFRGIDWSLGWVAERRDSNQAPREYDYRLLRARLSVGF